MRRQELEYEAEKRILRAHVKQLEEQLAASKKSLHSKSNPSLVMKIGDEGETEEDERLKAKYHTGNSQQQ